MTRINVFKYTTSQARIATKLDRRVLLTAHPLAYWIIIFVTKIGNVVRIPLFGVVVSEGELLRKILLDGEHFSKIGPGSSSEFWTPVVGANGLMNMDGSKHLELRRKISPMFTAKFIESIISDVVTPQLDDLKIRLINGDSIDIVKEIELTAAKLICRLSGWDVINTTEKQVLEEFSNARKLLSVVKINKRKLSDREVDYAKQQLSSIANNIRKAYRENRSGTVIEILKSSGLSEEDTVSVLTVLIIAGTETVVSHVPRAVQLFINSGYINELSDLSSFDTNKRAQAEGKFARAIQEAFRVTVPSPVMLRSVSSPTLIGGKRVKAGDRVVLATYIACRRAGSFNPEIAIPKELRQIWFGAGVHLCIGMPLAMQQTEAYLKLLCEVNSEREVVIKKYRIRKNTLAAGYKELILQCK